MDSYSATYAPTRDELVDLHVLARKGGRVLSIWAVLGAIVVIFAWSAMAAYVGGVVDKATSIPFVGLLAAILIVGSADPLIRLLGYPAYLRWRLRRAVANVDPTTTNMSADLDGITFAEKTCTYWFSWKAVDSIEALKDDFVVRAQDRLFYCPARAFDGQQAAAAFGEFAAARIALSRVSSEPSDASGLKEQA
jgi:hypothetical protein